MASVRRIDEAGTAQGCWGLTRLFVLLLGCLSVALGVRDVLNAAMGGGFGPFPTVPPAFCWVAAASSLAVAHASRRQPPLVRWTYLAGSALLALIALNPWLHDSAPGDLARWALGQAIGLSFLAGTWRHATAPERILCALTAASMSVRGWLPPELQPWPLVMLGAAVVYAVSSAQSIQELVRAAFSTLAHPPPPDPVRTEARPLPRPG
jgi:hypothetical protein